MNLADPHIWISLVTLTVLEIVLGIDNIIFISILAGKLAAGEQRKARTIGLMLALITRVLLLCSIFWLTKLTGPLLPRPEDMSAVGGTARFVHWIQELLQHEFSGK